MDSFQTMVQWKCLQMKITWTCVKRETWVYGSAIEWCLHGPAKSKNNDEVSVDKAYHFKLLKDCVRCHRFARIRISHFLFVQSDLWNWPLALRQLSLCYAKCWCRLSPLPCQDKTLLNTELSFMGDLYTLEYSEIFPYIGIFWE